jgi:hypothetical protein
MKNLVFIVSVYLFNSSLYAQQGNNRDTTPVKHNDIYNQYPKNRQSENTFTIPFDTNKVTIQPNIIPADYPTLTKQADYFYDKKEFSKAIEGYTSAFVRNKDMGQVKHRYKLACCYVQTKQYDSAFVQLFRIAEKGQFYNYNTLAADSCFTPLHNDKRWPRLMERVQENAKAIEDKLNENTPQQ